MADIFGTDENDRITGTAAADLIQGGLGNDILFGLAGSDVLLGGAGNDILVGAAGDDWLYGGDGDDLLSPFAQFGGTESSDLVDGGSGRDAIDLGSTIFGTRTDLAAGISGPVYNTSDATFVSTAQLISIEDVYGGASRDIVFGDDGANTLVGLGGDDVLFGRGGNDVVVGGEGADILDGGDGDDYLDGYTGNDRLDGGAGADNVHGGDGNDIVGGGDGNDKLYGENGDDVITGGAGADELYGGAGADRFVYLSTSDSAPAAPDLIVDATTADRIDVSAIDAVAGTAANDAFHFVAAFTGAAGEAVLGYNPDNAMSSLMFDTNGDAVADMTVLAYGRITADIVIV